MKGLILTLLQIVLLTTAVAAAGQPASKEILSPTYTIDRIYRSMEGPSSMQRVFLGDPDHPELIWITGVRTEMVGEDGKSAQLPELMCHVNVDLDPSKHQAMLGFKRQVASRLVTLSQGMLSAQLPDGFGFPIASNEPLVLFTQVLNHNIEHPKNMKVRHRITFRYVRDRDLAQPLNPLFNLGASGMVLLDSPTALTTSMAGMPGMDKPSTAANEPAQHGTSCLLLPRAPNAAGTGSDYTDPQGRKVTGHWVVPPGRQVNHSDITWFLALPYDTVLHYAAVHLHPFAESLTVRDLTTDETLFTSKATGPRKGVGLSHVDTFSSQKGIPLHRDHQYELISVYDNPTKENHDSMASVFLALEDPEFDRPTSETLTARAADASPATNDTTVVLRTTAGDFAVRLYAERAPMAVRQVLRLIRAHVYEHAKFAVPRDGHLDFVPAGQLTAAQYSLLSPGLETAIQHIPGTLSICAGDPTISILLTTVASKDGRCSVFGQIGPGAAVVRELASAPATTTPAESARIEITRAEIHDAQSDGISLNLAPVRSIPSGPSMR